MLFAKLALGFGGTLVLATAYTFREGTIRVDVDEFREGGAHVHFWVPAAAVPMAMHFVPKRHMEHAVEHAAEWMPTVHTFLRELDKYPEAEFVNVQQGEQHVQVRTHNGKLQIDVDDPNEKVHLLCPLSTLDDVASELESQAPGA